jgi:hypothetical protein
MARFILPGRRLTSVSPRVVSHHLRKPIAKTVRRERPAKLDEIGVLAQWRCGVDDLLQIRRVGSSGRALVYNSSQSPNKRRLFARTCVR